MFFVQFVFKSNLFLKRNNNTSLMHKLFTHNVIYLLFRHKISFIIYSLCVHFLFCEFIFTELANIHNLPRHINILSKITLF